MRRQLSLLEPAPFQTSMFDVDLRNFAPEPQKSTLSLSIVNTLAIAPTPEPEIKLKPNPKLAAAFAKMADSLQPKIDDKFRDRPTHTRKMAEQARHSRKEGEVLEKIQIVARVLASGHEIGDINPAIAQITTKKQLEFIVPRATRYDVTDHELTAMGYERYSRWEPKHINAIYDTSGNDGYKDDRKSLVQAGIDTPEKLTEVLLAIKAMTGDSPQQIRDRAIISASIRLNNVDKRFGYFPTPKALVSELIDLADIRQGMRVLEPSAGKGDIADAIRAIPNVSIDVCELGHAQCEVLKLKGFAILNNDFMELTPVEMYDRVVMNPPFTTPYDKAADETHIIHAWKFLKRGGRLVAIASAAVLFRSDYQSFRNWIESIDGTITKNPDGSFKDSDRPTGVSTVTIVLDKI